MSLVPSFRKRRALRTRTMGRLARPGPAVWTGCTERERRYAGGLSSSAQRGGKTPHRRALRAGKSSIVTLADVDAFQKDRPLRRGDKRAPATRADASSGNPKAAPSGRSALRWGRNRGSRRRRNPGPKTKVSTPPPPAPKIVVVAGAPVDQVVALFLQRCGRCPRQPEAYPPFAAEEVVPEPAPPSSRSSPSLPSSRSLPSSP